jgi:predicted ATPase/DNA-binding SARP family transcriptional activator
MSREEARESAALSEAPLVITLFGPMQVAVHGQPLPRLRSRKALWLLALLALRHGRPVEREWLAGTLWPEVSERQSAASLRSVLSELRVALGSEGARLQSPSRRTLLLDLANARTDVLTFDAATAGSDPAALNSAVALYRGMLLEGVTEEWVAQERASREQACLRALLILAEKAATDGDHSEAASCWRRALSVSPLWDTARRGLMAALAEEGDTNAALHVYREFVGMLRSSDPKAAPDRETTALYDRLRASARQSANDSAYPTGAAAQAVMGYLPHPLTELVGREEERLEVAALLHRSRLVTLTGPGGIGKTRLTIAVAEEVIGQFPDGVWLVTLEAVSNPDLVPQTVARALGINEETHQPVIETLAASLKSKELLLVLDNCEHLLETCAHLAGYLLRECAGLRILATSREPLGVTGETTWGVPPLAVPDPDHLPSGKSPMVRVLAGYDGVRLFVERAQAVQKTFDMTGANARAVAEICYCLEGAPLAIEMAAARVRAMTVEQIAARLKDRLSGPLGLLTDGSRTALSRQRTLRSTLDWSHALLSISEQILLRRLSIFSGGWTLEAAEAVVGEGLGISGQGLEGGEASPSSSPNPYSPGTLWVPNPSLLDLLTSLVDKSLVGYAAHPEQDEITGPRYRLQEAVRQYATEKLHESGEVDAVRVKHRDWCLHFAEEAVPKLRTAEQEVWERRLVAEHDNLCAALDRVAAKASETDDNVEDAESAVSLAGALWWFWYARGHYREGRMRLEQALSSPAARRPTEERARALNGVGTLAYLQGDYVAARAYHEESLHIQKALGNQRGIAASMGNLANLAYSQNDFATARPLYEECLAIFRAVGNQLGMASALINLGNVARELGDPVASYAFHEESLAIYREVGDRRGMAWSLHLMGRMKASQGEHETAHSLLEESIQCFTRMEDKHGRAECFQILGELAVRMADYDAAEQHYEEAHQLFVALGERPRIAAVLEGKAKLACWQGRYLVAQSVAEEALTLLRSLENSEGIASILAVLGDVALCGGDVQAARRLYIESLTRYRELGSPWRAVDAVNGFADVLLAMGDTESVAEAVRLWGADDASDHRRSATPSVGGQKWQEQQLAKARNLLGGEGFAVAWEAGRALTWEQAVALALEWTSLEPAEAFTGT